MPASSSSCCASPTPEPCRRPAPPRGVALPARNGGSGRTLVTPGVLPPFRGFPESFALVLLRARHPDARDASGHFRTGPSEESGAQWTDLKPIPYCRLLPPEAFPKEPFHAGHVPDPSDHPVVGIILASHCSGGRHRPVPTDLHHRMKSATPSPVERTAIRTWLCEATKVKILEALCVGVHSARDPAARLHGHGWGESRFDLARTLNRYCLPGGRTPRRCEDPWHDDRQGEPAGDVDTTRARTAHLAERARRAPRFLPPPGRARSGNGPEWRHHPRRTPRAPFEHGHRRQADERQSVARPHARLASAGSTGRSPPEHGPRSRAAPAALADCPRWSRGRARPLRREPCTTRERPLGNHRTVHPSPSPATGRS